MAPVLRGCSAVSPTPGRHRQASALLVLRRALDADAGSCREVIRPHVVDEPLLPPRLAHVDVDGEPGPSSILYAERLAGLDSSVASLRDPRRVAQ